MTDDTTLRIVLSDEGSDAGPPPEPADPAAMRKSLADFAPAPVPPPPAPGPAAGLTARAIDGLTARANAGELPLDQAVATADRLARSPVGKQLDDVADRVSRGLLTLAEGLERTEKLGRRDAATDYARDAGYRDFAALAREAVERAAALAPARPAAVAAGRLDLAPAAVPPRPEPPASVPPPADFPPPPLTSFDFTPKGGVPFDFAPGAASPDAPTGPPKAFDYLDLRPADPKALKAAMAGNLPAAAEGDGLRAAAGAEGAGLAAGAAAAVLAAEAAAGAFKAARGDLMAVGAAARDVAGNDGLGAVAAVGDRAAAGLETGGLGGKVAAEGLRLAAAGLREFDQTSRAMVARARELSQYDGRLAAATANADVRRQMADMAEAQRTAVAQSRLIDSQSRLDEAIQRGLAPIKSVMAERLADMADRLATVAEVAGGVAEVVIDNLPSMKATTEAGFALIGSVAPGAGWALRKLQEEAAKITRAAQQRRDEEEEKLMEQLFRAADALGLRPPDPNAQEAQRQQDQLGIPLLSR